MPDPSWQDVDRYLSELFFPPDDELDATLEAGRAAGLPQIQVSAAQGRLLELLVRLRNARRVLEIGTLAGYSTMWMARGLPPGGSIVTLELSPLHAEVARKNLDRGGYSGSVEIRVGPATESLAALEKEDAGPFDLVFIDADKEGYPEYFDRSMRLSAPGTLLVIDNVIRAGKVADAESSDENVQGVREMNRRIAARRELVVTSLQLVGAKGWDGITLAYVTA
jgi:predicted O-methyltransferase YrrM